MRSRTWERDLTAVARPRRGGWPAPATTEPPYFGGQKVDGEWVRHEASILVLPDATEREALLGDPRVYVPAYLGPTGWIGFELPTVRAAKTRWAEVAELSDASYRNTAGKRHVAELLAEGSDDSRAGRLSDH